MLHKVRLFILLFPVMFVLYTSLTSKVWAQHRFGVHYSPPTDTITMSKQLDLLASSGVTNLIIDSQLDYERARLLQDYDFTISIDVGLSYHTLHTLRDTDIRTLVANRVSPFIDANVGFEHVILTRYSALSKPGFRAFIASEQQIFAGTSVIHQHSLRYVVNHKSLQELPLLVSITSSEQLQPHHDTFPLGISYKPASDSLDIRDFQGLLTMAQNRDFPIVFLDGNWLFDLSNVHLSIWQVLREFSDDPNSVFPNPALNTKTYPDHVLVLLFLLLWISFAVHALINPPYVAALLRYIQTHNFFVTDIIERRIRFSTSNVVLLMQIAVMGGILIWLWYTYRLSPEAVVALSIHLGFNSVLPGWLVFAMATITTLIISTLFLGWLYLSNPELKHLSQASVLYFWPQHLLFLVASFAILSVLRDSNLVWLDFALVLFFTLIVISFFIASVDVARYVPASPLYFTLSVFVLFPATLSILLVVLLHFNKWGSVFQLLRTM